jgi:hypothetical protein
MMGMDMTMLAKLLKGGVGSAQQGVRQMGNVFNPQAGLGGGAPVDPNGLFAQQGGGGPKDLRRSSAPQPVTPEKTPWMEQTALGGFSRGDLLLAGMGMLSGKNFKEGLGNASNVAFDALGRQREQSEKQKQSAALLKYMTANGKMAPEAAVALIDAVGPEAAIGQINPDDAEGFTLGPNQARYDAAGNLIVDNPVADKPPTAMSALGKLRSDLKAGFITPEDYEIGLAELQRSGVNVNVNTGDVAAGERPIIDKPPKDYQAVWDAENNTYRMEPIPGSDAARDREGAAIKANTSIRLADQQFELMSTSIDKAIEQADFWSAGLMAQATSGIGATPARNLRATLDTIMANIGFEKLQEMRETSPTGGALGNVTERELAFLQSVRGSLDQIQDPAQLREVLGQVKESLAIIHEIRKMNLQGNMTNSGERIPTGDASSATDLPPGFEVVQ